MLKEPSLAKTVALNSPKKYRRIVEPFADGGVYALYPGKKRPKTHIANFADEMKFAMGTFLQGLTAADKKRLKAFDWIASPETFEAVASMAAMEGPEMFYRENYLMKFGLRSADPEAPPAYDHLKTGHDLSPILYELPAIKAGLKRVTLSNDDPLSVLGSASGSDTFIVLLPRKPEDAEAVEARLPSLSSPFFYAKKSPGNDALFESVASNGQTMNVSYVTAASIMVALIEVRTNYDNGLPVLEPLKE